MSIRKICQEIETPCIAPCSLLLRETFFPVFSNRTSVICYQESFNSVPSRSSRQPFQTAHETPQTLSLDLAIKDLLLNHPQRNNESCLAFQAAGNLAETEVYVICNLNTAAGSLDTTRQFWALGYRSTSPTYTGLATASQLLFPGHP